MLNLWTSQKCLLCHEDIEPDVSWGGLFGKEETREVCGECDELLPRITGETCGVCGRPFAYLDAEYVRGSICFDCERWEQDERWTGSLDQNIALYRYTNFTKEVVARFKFRGDYVLASVFAADLRRGLNAFHYDYLVPVPLSGERLYERGFNQAEALIVKAGGVPAHLLSRVHTEKQSKKSRSERIDLEQIFMLAKDVDVRGKTILLVDDIYTTGSTLRHAGRLLKEHGAARVYSLTLAR